MFLKISQNSQENTCVIVYFSIKLQAHTCNFVKKETLAQVFSCEFCEISKNNFFTEHLWATASRAHWSLNKHWSLNGLEVFYWIVVGKYFAKFTGKHHQWRPFLEHLKTAILQGQLMTVPNSVVMQLVIHVH